MTELIPLDECTLEPVPDETARFDHSTLSTALATILEETTNDSFLIGCFERMEWAEEEIQAAGHRHPHAADTLYHSFSLLPPSFPDLMSTEFVYRSHARELLERVVRGEDTRPGTAAEVFCLMSQISLMTPLNTAAAGLYFRMWAEAFPHQPMFGELESYEKLERPLIDDFETEARRQLRVADRKPGAIECSGRHHGEIVQCSHQPRTAIEGQAVLVPAEIEGASS